MPEMKRCSKCGEKFPKTTEYFKKAQGTKDGFYGQCRKCVSVRDNIYHEKNKEHIKEQNRIYRQDHKKERLESQRRYREENNESYKEKAREYRERTRENRSKYNKEYINKNKEYWSEWFSNYTKEHSVEINIKTQRYRSKKRNLPNTLTDKQWDGIKNSFNNSCAYCGETKKLTVEHFIPVSKDGELTINNILPICPTCNSSRGNKDFFLWYHKQSFYSKKREQKILKHLGYNKLHQQQLSLI